MKASFVYPTVFVVGGMLYGLLELFYRGRTHWAMLIVGGLCVLQLYLIAAKSDAPVWRKWITGGVIITTVEFISGILLNIVLGLAIWDYSPLPLDLFGQICLSFFLCWVILSIPAVWLLRFIDTRVFGKGGVVYDTAGSN